MIQEVTREKLSELKGLLTQLTDEQLTTPLEVLHGSTLGMHLRHILEFYQCLFLSLDERKLNYDLRKRDKNMEISKKRCLECILWLQKKLHRYTDDVSLELSADYSLEIEEKAIHIKTSYFRELLYNVEHCVHHLAIIKIGIKVLDPSLTLEEHMGVAASTMRNNKACAP